MAQQIKKKFLDPQLVQDVEDFETILSYQKFGIFETDSNVFADATAGRQDALFREGWYYKNDETDLGTSGDNKINWYFYNGQANDVALGDLSGYAVITFDTVFSPIMSVYTVPTGPDSWYTSRVNYSGLSATPEIGKKYLVYFGEDPVIHPELPRLQLGVSASTTVGPQDPSERVLTVAIGTNSIAPVNSVQMVVQHLGIYSPTFKSDLELKIQVQPVPAYHTMKVVLDAAGITSIDLDHLIVPKSINVTVGRVVVHLDEDFEITEVGGVSRLTWIGSLQVGGAEAVVEGDTVFVNYSYLA